MFRRRWSRAGRDASPGPATSRRRFLTATASGALLGAAGSGGRLSDPLTADKPEFNPRLVATSSETEGAAGEISIEVNGENGVYTFTPTGWADGRPPIMLRVSHPEPDNGGYGAQHFLIVPYEFGMAIEYPGVVEHWVAETSFHTNNATPGPSQQGAIVWIGNTDDTGGLHFTAYRDPATDAKFSAITAQLFDKSSGGDLRMQVRDITDAFRFRVGKSGAEVEVAALDALGDLSLKRDLITRVARAKAAVFAADVGHTENILEIRKGSLYLGGVLSNGGYLSDGANAGVYLRSPDGTYFALRVNDDGSIRTVRQGRGRPV